MYLKTRLIFIGFARYLEETRYICAELIFKEENGWK